MQYLVTRTLPPLNEEELQAVGKKVVEVCSQMENVNWVRSNLTADGKHSFCVLEAPNAEACVEHAKLAGLPVDNVVPLGLEIGPNMFK